VEGSVTGDDELSQAQLAAVMAAILRVTGASKITEIGDVTKEQWREAFEIAGVPWQDYDENWQTH
jgi:hypothetical protein